MNEFVLLEVHKMTIFYYMIVGKFVIFGTLKSTYSFIFIFFNEILDLGLPVNAPSHYRSPIFIYNNVALNKDKNDYLIENIHSKSLATLSAFKRLLPVVETFIVLFEIAHLVKHFITLVALKLTHVCFLK